MERVRSQRRGLTRVLLSLIMQENTQSNIIRKLNSHARYVRLKAALFECNDIFKSAHIQNLIGNMQLRKAIRSARNRSEAYHQFQSNIRKAYHGIFQGKRIVENRSFAHATRLIANCIIAYNSMTFNSVYERMLVREASMENIDEFPNCVGPHTAYRALYCKKITGNRMLKLYR